MVEVNPLPELSFSEFAATAKVSERTARRWVANRSMNGLKVLYRGRRVWFPVEEARRWLMAGSRDQFGNLVDRIPPSVWRSN